MTCKTTSLPMAGCHAPGARVRFAGAWPLLVTLCALPIALSWAGTVVADTRVAMSGWLSSDPIKLGSPELSPDGNLAALHVYFGRSLPRLAVFDLDREKLVVLDRPDNEGWLDPSFSPFGDRIAFVRYCVSGCATGKKGFQVSVYDRKSGVVTRVTEGSHLQRVSPLFSPDGRSIVFSAKDLVWKEEWLARGFKWMDDGPHTTLGGGTLRIVELKKRIERKILHEWFGVTEFSYIAPSGFVDGNTLIFRARWPEGPLFRELGRLVGAKDAKYGLYGYRLTLGEKLEFMSPDAPKRIGKTSSLSVSSDTGRMVFTGLSGQGQNPKHPGRFHYDVFLGDGETFEPATSLFTYMGLTTISKSGNRVAFLADDTRRRNWSLWVLDVESSRVWETSLKPRLEEWHRASGRK